MASQLVAAMPCSVWSSRVASMIRRRVCAAAEALRVMSYFRGATSLTHSVRVMIVAGVVLLKSPKGATYGDPPPGPDGPAVLVLRHARRDQGVRRRHRRPVHAGRDDRARGPADPAARPLPRGRGLLRSRGLDHSRARR